MKAKRPALIVLVAGLALVVVVVQFWPADEPTYQGKTVSVWFKEYAYSSNAPPPGLYTFPYSANANVVRWMGGVSNVTPTVTSALRAQRGPAPRWPGDPSLVALQALGSKAVPYLVRQLRYGRLDRAYTTVFTNFPTFVQRKLPNPGEKQWYRIRAMDALGDLGMSAQAATPALLTMLHQGETRLRSRVLATLPRIYADGHSISGLLLQLGAQRRYAEVLEIARQTKWQGREVAQLFGEILQATNTALHRDAIYLLESSGERAAPALDGILAALRNTDGEVRYLAARTVENIGLKRPPAAQPRIVAALEASLHDEKDTVRNVARRALAKLSNSAEAPAVDPLQRPPDEVNYDGKTVEEWFQAYVAGADMRTPPHAPPLMNGELLWPSSLETKQDLAWEAFQRLGEQAVPCLVRHLDVSATAANPERARLERTQAIELIHRLGTRARSAAPALLTLLKQVEEAEAEAVCAAVASVRLELQLINQFLLDLGKTQRNADMLYYARRLGWNGPEVARRLGAMLPSPDREEAHGAIALLEAAGPEAHAATEAIIVALGHRDQEIRYLAARSLANLAGNSLAAMKALQSVADDPNGMVRTVARKAIAAQAETLSPGPRD